MIEPTHQTVDISTPGADHLIVPPLAH